MRAFNITQQIHTAPGLYEVQPNCNCITVTNTGDAIVYFNGMVLYPGTVGSILGDSITVAGAEGEIYKGSIQIAFGAGATPRAEVIQKYYV